MVVHRVADGNQITRNFPLSPLSLAPDGGFTVSERTRVARGLAVLGALCALVATSDARAEGAMTARRADGHDLGLLPLTHTDVHVEISGEVESVGVTQRFHNALNERIEAVYVFPLPERAAVSAMEMHIGARVIRAEIRRRADAREAYDAARNSGRQAALLDQERPNVFTFSVANIDPGQDIDVTLRYVELARYDHGTFEMAFPMVVGPRYIPGTPVANAATGGGPATDTDRVPDASRISTTYLPPGTRAGDGIDLAVHLDAGTAIRTIESNSHAIHVVRASTGTADIRLEHPHEIPNRDFVLRWQLAAATLQTTVFTHRPDGQTDGYVGVMLEPPRSTTDSEIAPREIFFLLDTSGSMMGEPLETARAAIRHALRQMQPRDAFQLVDFADTASSFAPSPLPATLDNVQRAIAYLDSLQASGGTNQLAGIHAALAARGDPSRLRYVVFMTDGYIGDEHEVIGLVRREIGRARVFGFGIGSSVNRFLLDEVSAVGRGVAEYIRPGEPPRAMVERFYERIARPYLTDVQIDWAGVPVTDVQPGPLPDLSALQPLVAFARYHTPGHATLRIRGRLAGNPYETLVPVDLPALAPTNVALSRLWAREKITALSRAMYELGESPERIASITQVALAHSLMSAYTSFVAVDSAPPTAGPGAVRVQQPGAAPEGVNLNAAGGVGVSGSSIGDAFGYGGLGSVGSGWGGIGHGGGTGTGQGYGAGAGRGLVGRGSVGPLVRGSTPAVMGMLAVDVIRRVVLRNLGQITHCYETRLAINPNLAGRISLRWMIASNGTVIASTVAEDAIHDADLVACLNAAIRRWTFPGGGGVVTVTYPFNFAPPR